MTWKILFAAVAIIGIVTGRGVSADQPGFILEIRDEKNQQGIVQLPIQPREVFYIKSIHSLALTPYTHIYQFDEEGHIILSGAIFESGGGGYPVAGDGVFSVVDGKFRMDQMNRFVGKLRFRVSPVSQETFSLREVEIPLHKRVPEGTLVEIGISRAKE